MSKAGDGPLPSEHPALDALIEAYEDSVQMVGGEFWAKPGDSESSWSEAERLIEAAIEEAEREAAR